MTTPSLRATPPWRGICSFPKELMLIVVWSFRMIFVGLEEARPLLIFFVQGFSFYHKNSQSQSRRECQQIGVGLGKENAV